jgi:catechol 2,3-dioxygenase-like lactoylglutathione lyase family enzyme
MPRFNRISPRVPVADLDGTIEFYTTLLDFSLEALEPEDAPVSCVLDRDEVSIGFYIPDEPEAGPGPGTGMFLIDVEDVEGLHAVLKDRVEIAWGPEVYPYARREFAVYDPEGNLLIFSEPTGDPPTVAE